MPNFKCGLCKNYKTVAEKMKIIFIMEWDAHMDLICTNCFYQMYNIFKCYKLSEKQKQTTFEKFGMRLDHG